MENKNIKIEKLSGDKLLDYKGIVRFDEFSLFNDDYANHNNKEFYSEDIQAYDGEVPLNEYEYAHGYICPSCSKKYGIGNSVDDNYDSGYICCVEGCCNTKAEVFEIRNLNECKIVKRTENVI